MKKGIFLTLIVLLGVCSIMRAQSESEYHFNKTTHSFAMRDDGTLYLDRYTPLVISENEKMPCILFVFGGAFARGARDVPKYMPYFEYLVNKGYTVVSIDYRLGLKEAAERKGVIDEESFIRLFVNAIDIAVEDLFDATTYILQHAEEWNIDTSNIIANGSSAGAVTVLQAEHAICNGTHNVRDKLPADFNYSGIISFAGAIFVPNGGLTWLNRPCPIMLLHGDADLQVPYDNLLLGNMGFYGAKGVSETLDVNDYPYYFYKFDDYGHEIASDPMQNNKEDVLWFLNTFIKENRQYKIFKEQKEIGKPAVRKNFGLQDYIMGNFDR